MPNWWRTDLEPHRAIAYARAAAAAVIAQTATWYMHTQKNSITLKALRQTNTNKKKTMTTITTMVAAAAAAVVGTSTTTIVKYQNAICTDVYTKWRKRFYKKNRN